MLILGATLILAPRVVRKSFALETYHVGVYWDAKCTKRITSISWGELAPGSTSTVGIYIRNEELAPSAYVALLTEAWTPQSASDYLQLSWNYEGNRIPLGGVTPVTLTLRVARNIVGITDFSFNITIFGTDQILGDLDHDGNVDIYDVVIFAGAYGSTRLDVSWLPEADLNEDNVIDIYDAIILSQNYEKF